MGLIRAAVSAAGSVLADQWKEYFYCDALSTEVLAVRASKRSRGGNKGSDNGGRYSCCTGSRHCNRHGSRICGRCVHRGQG